MDHNSRWWRNEADHNRRRAEKAEADRDEWKRRFEEVEAEKARLEESLAEWTDKLRALDDELPDVAAR